MDRKTVLSGIRPSGGLHIGNILGAVNNMVSLQDSGEHDCFFFIADLHAGTTDPDFGAIKENTSALLVDMLAVGLDPERSLIFRQSDIPELYQLYTLFCFVATVSELQRNPVYKEQLKELKLNGNGLSIFLNYPVLQAADICLYKANLIPVGQDQIPHIEVTRDIARRFNELCGGSLFPIPEPLLTETPKVPGTDGRKMSKSYNNFIALSDSEEETSRKVGNMLTDVKRPRLSDSGHPDECPVFTLHNFFSSEGDVEEIRLKCQRASIGCKNVCKPSLAGTINKALRESRQQRNELMSQPDFLESILREGAERARTKATQTIKEVRKGLRFSV